MRQQLEKNERDKIRADLLAEEKNALGTHSLYSLYWYKSTYFTGTKVLKIRADLLAEEKNALGAHFTCFIVTRIQILTEKRYAGSHRAPEAAPENH